MNRDVINPSALALTRIWLRAAVVTLLRPGRRRWAAAAVALPLTVVWLGAWALGGAAQLGAQNAAPKAPARKPPTTTGAPARPPANIVPAVSITDGSVLKNRNPFGLRTGSATPATSRPLTPLPPPQPPPLMSVPDLNSRLALTGTYVSRGQAYAFILNREKNQEDVYPVGGSPFPAARITHIGPREAHLVVDGQPAAPLVIQYDGPSSGGRPEAPPVAPPPPGVPSYYNGQVPASDSVPDLATKKLARAEVDQYLDNLNTLLTQVNVQPVFQGGRPAGFRLTDIQKGTILDQVGIQDGDTLRFVNGQRIDSVQAAFQLYNILKESNNVEITVLRNTRPVTMRYSIQ